MINKMFKIKDKDYDRSLDGFLQLLGTISRHDDHRAAIHIPTKYWTFYKLNEMTGYRPMVWLREREGEYFLKETFGNLYGIKSNNAGRLMIEITNDIDQYVGKVVEVTFRYKKGKIVDSMFTTDIEAPSMERVHE